jgi:integrase
VGPKSKANRELAVQKLASVLATPTKKVRGRRITVAELVDQFLDHSALRVAADELKSSTLVLSYKPYGRLVRHECGHWVVHRIDEPLLRAYKQELVNRSISPTTVKNRLHMLRRVLRWARRGGLIGTDVYQLVPTAKPRRRELIPSESEVDRLLAAADPDVRDVLTMVLNAPLRPGDCYALRRRSVDLSAGLLRLPDSKTGSRLVCLVPAVRAILDRRLSKVGEPDDFV